MVSRWQQDMARVPCWSSGWDSVLPLQGVVSLILGQETRILHAMQYSQKKKKVVADEPWKYIKYIK